MEFHRTGRYDFMHMKTKELGWNEAQGIQNIGIEDFQGNRIVDQKQVLKIGIIMLQNYMIHLMERKP